MAFDIENFDLDEKSSLNFLTYASSVNKARAIPLAEDNLKPIHRKILYTLYITKLTSDKEPKKSLATVGEVLKISPHGDAATYGALVRLAQGWKLRYPLVEMQGNMGNLLGDGPAAARYTNAKLSRIGDLMLEDIDKDCVKFVPNYDESMEEPVTLPSKFPFLLCGNNSGIGVSLSSDIVSHNFTEVKGAIEHYLDHKDCTISDLMQFIKGPDFPTGGRITNGEDLYNIYSTGRGVLKMESHYDITTSGKKTLITFHDLPYGVEIDSGVKAPLKKLLLEEGYEDFDNIEVKKTRNNFFDITISLNPKANVAACLNILLTKTQLVDSVKVNNTVIKDGDLVTLNLKQMIETYVDYRSGIIKRIAQNNYEKVNHKLTVILGLQKCMSDIDTLVHLIRFSENRNAAKIAIKDKFSLNDEQADAVLDMKLSKLSRLDIADLTEDQKEQEKTLALLKDRIENEQTRYKIIKQDLQEIKEILGEDKRLTEITYNSTPEIVEDGKVIVSGKKQLFYSYADGRIIDKLDTTADLIGIDYTYGSKDLLLYNKAGEMGMAVQNPVASFMINKEKVISVTKNGNIKVTLSKDYKLNGKTEKVMKLKEDDEIVYIGTADSDDFILLTDGKGSLLKLAVKNLAVASKLTVGVKSGLTEVVSALIVSNSDTIAMISNDYKAKLFNVKDFSEDNRGNKGQSVYEKTNKLILCNSNREDLYLTPSRGAIFVVKTEKLSLKGKTAAGITLSSRSLKNVI